MSANRRVTSKMPNNPTKFREILKEVETTIERLEGFGHMIRREVRSGP